MTATVLMCSRISFWSILACDAQERVLTTLRPACVSCHAPLVVALLHCSNHPIFIKEVVLSREWDAAACMLTSQDNVKRLYEIFMGSRNFFIQLDCIKGGVGNFLMLFFFGVVQGKSLEAEKKGFSCKLFDVNSVAQFIPNHNERKKYQQKFQVCRYDKTLKPFENTSSLRAPLNASSQIKIKKQKNPLGAFVFV